MSEKSTPDAARAILVALLDVVSERGLERATVREVATAAGVAIGTVQHYFPTKDDMIVAAFTEVVGRITARVDETPIGDDVESDLTAVLRELLPLDEARRREARVQLAFAARAAVSPPLAALQNAVLRDVREALTAAFRRTWGTDDEKRCRDAAAATLALVDGLAMHSVSAGSWDDTAIIAAFELTLASILR